MEIPKMKIALLGYGKMGRLIEQSAIAHGHEITGRFSLQHGIASHRPNALASADIAIDFSHASAVLPHLDLCLSMGKPLLIGTTGWEDQLPEAQQIIGESPAIGCLYAPNFSLGFCLFQKIIAYAASLLQSFPSYDVCGIESHHKEKKDSPSGSAKALIRTVLNNMPRLTTLPFSSVRCGHIPGNHSLLFDSPADTITLTHEARSREGFVQGVFTAVDWLVDKKGLFTLDDMIQNMMSREQT